MSEACLTERRSAGYGRLALRTLVQAGTGFTCSVPTRELFLARFGGKEIGEFCFFWVCWG